MISKRRRSPSGACVFSSRSSAACPIEESGLRISCAIEAVGLRVAAPGDEHARDLGRILLQRRPPPHRHRSEELGGARIGLADAALPVDHEHAVLHVADDELVDLRQVGEVDLALLGDLLAGSRVACERRSESRGGEERRRRDARLHEVLQARVEAPHLEGLLEQHRERGDGGMEESEPATRDETGRGERHQQDHAQARAHAAARVHQHHDRDDVDDDARGHLQHQVGLAQPRRHEQHQRGDRIGHQRRRDRAGIHAAEVEEAVKEDEGEADEGGQHHAVEAEDRERAPRRGVRLGDQLHAPARGGGDRDRVGGGAHAGPVQRGLSLQ